MLADYGPLAAIATNMIATMGRSAILRAIEGGAEVTVTALMSHYGERERDGRLITHDDKRALIAATSPVAPDPEKHRFVMDGKPFRIVTVRTVMPATTVLYYDCQIRA